MDCVVTLTGDALTSIGCGGVVRGSVEVMRPKGGAVTGCVVMLTNDAPSSIRCGRVVKGTEMKRPEEGTTGRVAILAESVCACNINIRRDEL